MMHLMLLRESQGKRLLSRARIAVPRGGIATTAEDLSAMARSFPVVLKADVSSGGRGKAGGVRRCEDIAEALGAFDLLMHTRFDGELPRSVLVEPWLSVARELYLAVTVDGTAGGFVALYSPRGGMDIEAGAPPIRYAFGSPARFRAYRMRAALAGVEADVKLRERVVDITRQLVRLARDEDCITVEINPLLALADGSLVCGDAKVVRDEAAAFRNADIAAEIEQAHGDDPEGQSRCRAAGLALVPLAGDIGLISTGAGMTMAAMDVIDAAGGRPACFLDCSGNPTPDGFAVAFDVLERDPGVGVILVSVFGGGMHVDRVARTLIDILAKAPAHKPVVFRLNGTGGARATELLEGAGYRNHDSLEAAVASTLAHVSAAA